jgi:Putative bacterial sensory transduction regulator
MGSLLAGVCAKNGWKAHDNEVMVPLPGGRHQGVRVESFAEAGEELVRLHSVIGRSDSMGKVRMEAALRLNGHLRHGAIAIKDGDLVLIDTLLLADLSEDELERSIQFLAQTADQYEREIFGTDEH